MTNHETFEKLGQMRMHAFARSLHDQLDNRESYDHLAFDDRVAILVDREWTEREARSLTRRLQIARLRDRSACLHDIDYRHRRGLDKTLMQRLGTCEWIKNKENVILEGKTGCGKTFIACALGHNACCQGYSVIYRRLPRLLQELLGRY